jgi:hypothetical protein
MKDKMDMYKFLNIDTTKFLSKEEEKSYHAVKKISDILLKELCGLELTEDNPTISLHKSYQIFQCLTTVLSGILVTSWPEEDWKKAKEIINQLLEIKLKFVKDYSSVNE